MIFQMHSYAERLLLKANAVLKDYRDKVVLEHDEPIVLNAKQLELFDSMKRWHCNAHMSEKDWKICFENVKHKLDVKEKMSQLDSDLEQFLKVKFAKTENKDRWTISDSLDFLVSDIRELYQKKLDDRDEEQDDEFDTSCIAQGMKPDDAKHYSKVFLPVAIFLTYREKHPWSKRSALMSDAFSLGAGSERDDLVPEITGLCVQCPIKKEFEHFRESDIDSYNKKLFLLQCKNKFQSSYSFGDSDDDSIDSFSVKEAKWYNPFDSSSPSEVSDKENDVELDKSVTSFACQCCMKSFSRKEFLDYHTECFHKTTFRPNVVQFVSDPENLMLSFCRDPAASSPDLLTDQQSGSGVQDKSSKQAAKPTKKVTRRSLRFQK
jgi:hypothetical protein